jgi:flagellar biosynthesis GTPase FlhF
MFYLNYDNYKKNIPVAINKRKTQTSFAPSKSTKSPNNPRTEKTFSSNSLETEENLLLFVEIKEEKKILATTSLSPKRTHAQNAHTRKRKEKKPEAQVVNCLSNGKTLATKPPPNKQQATKVNCVGFKTLTLLSLSKELASRTLYKHVIILPKTKIVGRRIGSVLTKA